MAVKLRLTRVGSKKNPIYRVVAADSRSPRDGKFIEIVGRYNPQSDPSLIELDEEKVRGWLAKGAQPTESVAKLLKTQGISREWPPRGHTHCPGGCKRVASRRPQASRWNHRDSCVLARSVFARPSSTLAPGRPLVGELVAELARRLVDEPDAVRVEQVEEDDGTLVLELYVAEGDVGKVIGRQGGSRVLCARSSAPAA